MFGTQCVLFLMLCAPSTMRYASYPRLDYWVSSLLSFSSRSSESTIINDLEKYNWTRPAIARFDKWMSKNWIDPEHRNTQWPVYSGKGEGRKETRDTMKMFLYNFKAKKNYIDYLCKAAIEEGLYNKEDTEKIRKIYSLLQYTYMYSYAQSTLFNPMYSEYQHKNVNTANLVNLKAISDKYLEDKKQEGILKWNYYDYDNYDDYFPK